MTNSEKNSMNKIAAEYAAKQMNRRAALSTAGKAAAGIAAIAVIGGAAYAMSNQGAAPAASPVTVTAAAQTVTGAAQTITAAAQTVTAAGTTVKQTITEAAEAITDKAAIKRARSEPRPTEPMTFVIWPFRPDQVQVSVNIYQDQLNENVNLETVTTDYFSVLEVKLLGGDLDMAYTTPDFAHRMWGAGLIRNYDDIEEHEYNLWDIDTIRQDIIDSGYETFVRTYTTLDNNYIGIPYYQSSLGCVQKNEVLAETVGLRDDMPANYAELYAQIDTAQEKGISQPLIPLWYIAFPGWGISQGYVGEVLNRAGENGLFKSAPGFEVNFDTNSEAAETLKDWKRLYDKNQIPRGILSMTSDSDIDGMYATGKFLYGKWWLYMLRGWNDANFSKTIFPDGRPGTSVVPPKDHGWGYAVQQGYLARDIQDNALLRKRVEGMLTWFGYYDIEGRANHCLRIARDSGISAHCGYKSANTADELKAAWKPYLYDPETELDTMSDVLATTGWFEGTRALWSNEWMISCTDNIPIYLQGDLSLEDTIDRLREDAFELQAEYA